MVVSEAALAPGGLGGLGLAEIEQFVYTEARLCDERRYSDWEALWADVALYWVPAGPKSEVDPDAALSIIYDNRSRIALRVAQLQTGKRHSQDPASNVAHVISNLEIVGRDDATIDTSASFVAIESRTKGLTTWAGRVRHRLVVDEGRLLMSRKVVQLVNRNQPIPTMSFLI